VRIGLGVLAVCLILNVYTASASSNFLLISLPKGVSVELPKNWIVQSKNIRITLESWLETKMELAGITAPSSDLNFAANYYDDQGRHAAYFSIRYYPEQTMTQADSRAVTTADMKEADVAARASNQIAAVQPPGMRVLSWMGTTKQTINGTIAFVTEYRRTGSNGSAPFQVRLVRVLNADRSFTVTISYREDQEFLLRPICDRIIQSIRI